MSTVSKFKALLQGVDESLAEVHLDRIAAALERIADAAETLAEESEKESVPPLAVHNVDEALGTILPQVEREHHTAQRAGDWTREAVSVEDQINQRTGEVIRRTVTFPDGHREEVPLGLIYTPPPTPPMEALRGLPDAIDVEDSHDPVTNRVTRRQAIYPGGRREDIPF